MTIKNITKVVALLGIMVSISCSTDDSVSQEQQQQNAIANRTSTTCTDTNGALNQNVTGYTGLYWDTANGDNTAIGLLGQVPVIQNPGGQFIHSQQPILGFTLPQGFSAFESTGSGVIGADVILVDDLVDTAGTLCKAADILIDKGARSVRAICTHPVLSGNAIENINNSKLEQLIVCDTIPLNNKKSKKIKVLSTAKLFARAIRNTHEHRSISALFVEE